ncbi:LOW QUALITY PROTEIN: hypothetical protein ACHAXT_007647 [Thalassiosira profunda]
MAAAIKVTSAGEIATAFAANDEFLSRVAKNFWPGAVVMMEPGDDFYAAPYCLLKAEEDGAPVAYVVFTSYKARNPHYAASNDMKYDAPLVAPCTDAVMENLGVDEDHKFTFYAWAAGKDVDTALEDNAVKVTCDEMGWEFPADWRQSRRQQSKARCVGPVWDLEKYPRGMRNPYPPRSASQAGGIPGMQSCWSLEPGPGGSHEDSLKKIVICGPKTVEREIEWQRKAHRYIN